ncbi:MAG: DUF1523 family protein [Cypionkella sp.]|uniref:DUF1523 family protein n=1 Tax=Cypionkella sp. TaxID=2811411 RepID=UPI002AB8225D|nr:DUF1523 family protein [Cypionkella sp.]MDZ4311738.1 DUF1523 family protein [Cypionkella sp.]
MWTYVKWSFRILVVLLVGGFLHYTLPQHDIVRITNTYNRLTTVGAENSWAYASPDVGTGENTVTRDIRFIEAAFPDGDVIVYRNEDTGWIWPPYFKYDSSNLQAESGNLKSAAATPQWVSVTHYGWRLAWLSIYPNAVAVKEVAGPDTQIIPYVNIIVLLALAFGVFMLRRMWLQFWERMVEPAVAEVGETWDGVEAQAGAAKARASGFLGRIGAWFATWRKKR